MCRTPQNDAQIFYNVPVSRIDSVYLLNRMKRKQDKYCLNWQQNLDCDTGGVAHSFIEYPV